MAERVPEEMAAKAAAVVEVKKSELASAATDRAKDRAQDPAQDRAEQGMTDKVRGGATDGLRMRDQDGKDIGKDGEDGKALTKRRDLEDGVRDGAPDQKQYGVSSRAQDGMSNIVTEGELGDGVQDLVPGGSRTITGAALRTRTTVSSDWRILRRLRSSRLRTQWEAGHIPQTLTLPASRRSAQVFLL